MPDVEFIVEYYAHEDAQWRVDRLNKAVKSFCRIYGITEDQLSRLVISVSDRKGVLEVDWVGGFIPTPEQRRAFGIAWELCGEPSANVTHNPVI